MILERIAALIDRNIEASMRARELAARLQGRSFEVRVEGTPLHIFARIQDGGVKLSTALQGAADASVSGTPLALLSLSRDASTTTLRSGSVTIGGDAEVAQGFYELLRAARPDLEEELSRVVGDVAAHQIGNVVRGVAGWGRKAAQTAGMNISEYLQEESRDLVTRTEMDEFLNDVDSLRESTDRLSARLELIKSNP